MTKDLFKITPDHILRANKLADIILIDYPMHLHVEILDAIKERIIETHEENIKQIRKT
jgi:hypothetical protein